MNTKPAIRWHPTYAVLPSISTCRKSVAFSFHFCEFCGHDLAAQGHNTTEQLKALEGFCCHRLHS